MSVGPSRASSVPDHVPGWAPRFLEDCGRALRVWRQYPLLPLLTVLISVLPVLSGSGQRTTTTADGRTMVEPAHGLAGLAALAGLLSLLTLGFPGAQRLWYARAWHGQAVSLEEVFSWTLRQFGRWFVLGLAVAAASVPAIIPMLFVIARGVDVQADGTVSQEALPTWCLILSVLTTVVLDVLLTFVSPALVFTSHRVRDAVRIGLLLLRRTWPGSAAYALVPPLAVVVLSLYAGLPRTESVPLVALAALGNLLVKGATAALYLRVMPMVGVLGAMSPRVKDFVR